ncbi:catalase-domain-containing protein [Rhizodiscina lignyota]|uniref:Catalase n=1 Tax=Rhizodiscina lignyota TaxID=1504668 RepID=A0A9P4IHV3_9PEZI|nr:catalase-domain-containing protein [Rhizodiscina lignyota]
MLLLKSSIFAAVVAAQGCPYMSGQLAGRDAPPDHLQRRAEPESTAEFLDKFTIDDNDTFITSDVGGPIADQNSLSAGDRGPTLLEDFIFRQKIQHFDHERVPERAVHARGAGAHGVFTSYADWSNITAASFLGAAGKETPVFIRFSTVAGSRGSVDTARDVHGFATRFYTDEGNYDIVGNNIPIFFIQDAILFPDLIHAVKPQPDREIPQAATAHDTAWDFFSGQPSSLHTLFWAMAGNGIVRSFRHMDGFGIHTFRFVTEDGSTKLVKFHWKSMQGRASLVWEEAQAVQGKNGDYHRQDLWDAIESGMFPEWELNVQIMSEEDQLRFGFDLLDPTKIVPVELVPLTPIGKLTLNRNPINYFAETEQIMFQPGHIVRGIDFTEDPLLQGRIFSYLDTQLNRNGGPNFEQLPINQPRIPWHNNNRDGASQFFIPSNKYPYTPNTLNNGSPKQANQTVGNGFFTAPNRAASGKLVRSVSSTFSDVYSQPRLFFNSLIPAEQQFLINAMRFEASHITSTVVKQNVLTQLNRVDHDLAVRVGEALGMEAPAPDPTFYHNNKTTDVGTFGTPLKRLDGLSVGYLTTSGSTVASGLQSALSDAKVSLVVVAPTLGSDVGQTYSASDATNFDAVVVDPSADSILMGRTNTSSTLYPAGRPMQILLDAYRFGKPVAADSAVLAAAGIKSGPGVFGVSGTNLTGNVLEGLRTFKYLNRFTLDS